MAGVEMRIHPVRRLLVDAGRVLEVCQPRRLYAAGRAEMVQQRAFAGRADTGHFVELAADQRLAPASAMGGDGEPVRLVPYALQVVQHRVARRQLERVAPIHVEPLAPGVAVGTLGDGHDRDLVQPELGHDAANGRQLPGAAVDQQQVRDGGRRTLAGVARRLFAQGPAEATVEHFAHHGEVVTGGDRAANAVFTIGVFLEPVRPGHDHHPVGGRAHDVRVVVALDALGDAG